MMNNMPPYGMYPPMGPGNDFGNNMMSGGNSWMGGSNSLSERVNNLENQVNRMERQLRRIENRLSRLENSMMTPFSSQDSTTGYGNNNSKYMM